MTSGSSESMVPNVLGSAAAGIVARICTHPLDTAKARLQAVYGPTAVAPSSLSSSSSSSSLALRSSNPFRGPLDALLQTAKTEGVAGLYRGFGAVLVGGTPGTVVYLCAYDLAKERWADLLLRKGSNDNGDHFAVHFCAGMTAETVACVVYVPVDVVKERMQVQRRVADPSSAASNPEYYYRNSGDALLKILRTEGLAGIYRGYGATLASFGPYSALYFVFYERFKLWERQRRRQAPEQTELPFQSVLLCSAGAGALASWITSPLDMAKLRLQVSRGRQAAAAVAASASAPSATEDAVGGGGAAYRGVVDCLRQAYRSGGIPALFRGAGARVLHFTPATTITMTSYETCRSWIAQALSLQP